MGYIKDFRERGPGTGLRTLSDGSLVPYCYRNWMEYNEWCASCFCEKGCMYKTPQALDGGVKSIFKPMNSAEPNQTEKVLREIEEKNKEKREKDTSMDALEFLKEYKRMCYSFKSCVECPIYEEGTLCSDYIKKHPVNTVESIEKWSKEHPNKTMMDDFLEKFPKAQKRGGRYPLVCPHTVGYRFNALCPHHTTTNSTTSRISDEDCMMCWTRQADKEI